ncbi:cellulose binding domain-containing protein [Couchioplanes caeruleus]|uniref:cellulose binding domain-containing protein n=1 Tax=Couchioplanes caeruleus TaxID=56438 RepID=UPI0011609FEF|nr:cellulose binding domain-containing protein [Couchioplanes caeruleus]
MRQFGLPRYSFVVVAATMLVILATWVAVRAAGPDERRTPILIVPSASAPSTSPGATTGQALPIASPAASTPVAAPQRTPASRVPERAIAKPAPSSPPAAPKAAFTADYRTGAQRNRALLGTIQVVNTGTTARGWQVTLTYDPRAGVRLTQAWNAEISRSGDTWTITGGTLAPGAGATVGFQATKRTRDPVRPSGCVVNGTPCRIA